LAFAVPNIPSFSFSSWGTGGVARNLTPVQAGGTSRIGGAVGAWPPAGVEATFTAWGFMAGTAPPGATTLAVTASGFGTIERGVAETFAGYARAYGDIAVTVEEFEPLKPVHSGLGDLLDDGDGGSTADIGPGATAVLGTVVFKRSVTSVPTIIINQETTVLGFQAYVGDGTSHLTTLVMPITPGNAYRWWIICRQNCICQAVSGPAEAVSNIAFDFAPVFFAFTP
jgi:hypothetical protein